MRNIIVGTAGHVDHGKTLLIKALTGTDTDRLKEEKSRGITIELGFTNMPNSNNINVGIVDVPGHEKFIKNMLAGIGSIDLALLVVSGEEGVMPQTKEHFQILNMLGIKSGIIVITKFDLIDEEWLEVIKEDIKELVQDTFLEGAMIIEVSSFTGYNIEYLKEEICIQAKNIERRREEKEFLRVPVDRVFSVSGFGTVATGTLIEGICKIGDEVEIFPSEKKSKIRNIQVHGKDVEIAYAGQRTAINLANIKKDEIKRGDVISYKGLLKNSKIIDAKLTMFKNTKRKILDGSRLHLYLGSAEVLCKTILLEQDILSQGDEGYVQFRLEEEIAVKKGDRFIVSFYSPIETIGGGIVLDESAKKHKRYNMKTISTLNIKDKGNLEEIIIEIIREESENLSTISEITNKSNITNDEIGNIINKLLLNGMVFEIMPSIIVHDEYLDTICKISNNILTEYHKKNPISNGMPKEEFRKRVSVKGKINKEKCIDPIINELIKRNILNEKKGIIYDHNFSIEYTEEQEKMKNTIIEKYVDGGFTFPEIEEIVQSFNDKAIVKHIIDDLLNNNQLIKLSNKEYIHIEKWNEGLNIIEKNIDIKGSITLGEFRDLISTSRKYAIAILETFDDKKITMMVDDKRIRFNK